MKILAWSLFLLVPLSQAEEPAWEHGLMAESYEERQKAEQALIEWVGEKDAEDRFQHILERWCGSTEPEERFRLEKVLYHLKKDTILQSGEGFVGISMDTRNFEQRGVLVTEVIEDTPAERVGLLARDLILQIDGQSIAGASPSENLMAIVKGKPPGTKIKLTVLRGEEDLEIDVPLMNRAALKERTAWDPNRAEVDLEKAEALLRQDFRRWLKDQLSEMALGNS